MRALYFIVTATLLGCGSDPDPVAADSAPVDAGVETAPPDSRPAVDSAPEDTGIGGHGGTTGMPCTTNDECDVTGDGVNQCTITWYASGSLSPDPVCFGTECVPAKEDGKFDPCDEGKGWCLEYSSSVTRCFPQCHFDVDRDTAATGCLGKTACNYYGWVKDKSGAYHGTGYCFGGCTADSDCPLYHKCQTEYGECVFPKKLWVATKNVGDPCTAEDRGTSTKAPACACWMNSTVGKGYCSEFCKMGDAPSTCPAGFTCDAQLPTTGLAPFTAAAKGLAGACLKNCVTDDECAPLGGFCEAGVGTGQKTCHFGVRSGM